MFVSEASVKRAAAACLGVLHVVLTVLNQVPAQNLNLSDVVLMLPALNEVDLLEELLLMRLELTDHGNRLKERVLLCEAVCHSWWRDLDDR